jgi:hypothetical protein
MTIFSVNYEAPIRISLVDEELMLRGIAEEELGRSDVLCSGSFAWSFKLPVLEVTIRLNLPPPKATHKLKELVAIIEHSSLNIVDFVYKAI